MMPNSSWEAIREGRIRRMMDKDLLWFRYEDYDNMGYPRIKYLMMWWYNAKVEQCLKWLLEENPMSTISDLRMTIDHSFPSINFDDPKHVHMKMVETTSGYWVSNTFLTIALPLEEWGMFSD